MTNFLAIFPTQKDKHPCHISSKHKLNVFVIIHHNTKFYTLFIFYIDTLALNNWFNIDYTHTLSGNTNLFYELQKRIIKCSFTNNKAKAFNNLLDFLQCVCSTVPVPQVYFALCSTYVGGYQQIIYVRQTYMYKANVIAIGIY